MGAAGGGHKSLSLAVEPPDFIKSIPTTPDWGISFDNLSDPELPVIYHKKKKNEFEFYNKTKSIKFLSVKYAE